MKKYPEYREISFIATQNASLLHKLDCASPGKGTASFVSIHSSGVQDKKNKKQGKKKDIISTSECSYRVVGRLKRGNNSEVEGLQ